MGRGLGVSRHPGDLQGDLAGTAAEYPVHACTRRRYAMAKLEEARLKGLWRETRGGGLPRTVLGGVPGV